MREEKPTQESQVMTDEGGFGWAADPEAGQLVERFRGAGRQIRESDPRVDILIDMGILLGEEHNELYYELEKMLLSRAQSDEYIQYAVYVDDGLVFSAVYLLNELELGEFLVGPWTHRLSTLAKGIRRGRKSLVTKT